MLEVIEQAERNHQEAAEALLETVESCYPVGSLVHVESNVAHGKAIHTIKVEGHGSWYYNPTEIRGVNIVTGKPRKFSVGDIVRIVGKGAA